MGPSLRKEEAQEILSTDKKREVVYAPPIKRGDIPKAISAGFDIIGIIDGIFFRESAVSPRELMEALKAGTKIYGASSMGALRASELERYGMVGVGSVFSWYKDGTINSDDEVALTFDSEEFIPISEPLVNIKETVKKAHLNGVIDKEEFEAILKSAKSLYFPKRSWTNIIEKSEEDLGKKLSKFSNFLSDNKVDIKKEDAILLLKKIDNDSK